MPVVDSTEVDRTECSSTEDPGVEQGKEGGRIYRAWKIRGRCLTRSLSDSLQTLIILVRSSWLYNALTLSAGRQCSRPPARLLTLRHAIHTHRDAEEIGPDTSPARHLLARPSLARCGLLRQLAGTPLSLWRVSLTC
jgi:hypothetical protein